METLSGHPLLLRGARLDDEVRGDKELDVTP